ncbi:MULTISPECIES: stage II sporulation protein R [Sporosarcina]|uniref:Stage II sporulation protein R n=1 Tax=Sporosarcina contaminans TaxID=633403 RepID=A0ABW3TTT5_9BACL
MLQDYEIQKQPNWTNRIVAVVEFILVLFVIQSALLLFMGPEEQPEEIRFRILAHSNSPADQKIKHSIQQEIEPLIYKAIGQAETTAEIAANLQAIESVIYDIAVSKAEGKEISFERKAALFPPKRSGMFVTPQAAYDAYVLTIGSGRGDNWWCGLFPRVCFPDKEVDNNEEQEQEKVTFFIWEWIKSLFD